MQSTETTVSGPGAPARRMPAALLAAVALGLALGFGCWALLSLVQLLIELVWDVALPAAVTPLAAVAACAAGGAALGWWNRRFRSAPHPMGEVIALSREQGGYRLERPAASLVSFLAPLALGAPLGPEAGLSGFIAAGATRAADALHRVAFRGRVAGARFTSVQARALAVAGVAGGILGAKAWNLVSGREGIPRLPAAAFSLESLAWLLPLTVAGMALSWVLRRSDGLWSSVSARCGGIGPAGAAACGAVFALVSLGLPLVLFAGTEQLMGLLGPAGAHGSLELAATALAKVALLSLCLHMGWSGGPFFPLIFSAACLGVAISQLAGIDPVLAVTVLSAALVARFTRKLGLSAVVLALIVPLRGMAWALVPLAAGALLPTVEELIARRAS